MNREELLQALTELGTITDDAERRSRITSLSDELTSIFDTNETLTATNTQLEADKKKLQEYNMELYLKVGSQGKKKEPEPKSEELTYENLFNEKGELK